MTPLNAGLNQDEVQTLRDYVVMNDTVKRLDKDKKALTEKVKNIFEAHNVDVIDIDGSTLTVTESMRKTINKKTKDAFVSYLCSIGKNYLCFTDIAIDADTVYAEMENGSIDKTMVEKYMSVTPVKTLTCK